MKLLGAITAITLVGVTLAAVPSASFATSSDVVVVPSVRTVNGSGCKAGHETAMDIDGNTWSFTFPHQQMVAAAGAGTAKVEARKNCQISMRAEVPQGYRYGVKKITLSGSAYVEQGASVSVQGNSYFMGETANQPAKSPLVGPFAGPFSMTHEFPLADISWSPCAVQRNFNLNVAMNVNSGTQSEDSYSWVRMDEAKGITAELVVIPCES